MQHSLRVLRCVPTVCGGTAAETDLYGASRRPRRHLRPAHRPKHGCNTLQTVSFRVLRVVLFSSRTRRAQHPHKPHLAQRVFRIRATHTHHTDTCRTQRVLLHDHTHTAELPMGKSDTRAAVARRAGRGRRGTAPTAIAVSTAMSPHIRATHDTQARHDDRTQHGEHVGSAMNAAQLVSDTTDFRMQRIEDYVYQQSRLAEEAAAAGGAPQPFHDSPLMLPVHNRSSTPAVVSQSGDAGCGVESRSTPHPTDPPRQLVAALRKLRAGLQAPVASRTSSSLHAPGATKQLQPSQQHPRRIKRVRSVLADTQLHHQQHDPTSVAARGSCEDVNREETSSLPRNAPRTRKILHTSVESTGPRPKRPLSHTTSLTRGRASGRASQTISGDPHGNTPHDSSQSSSRTPSSPEVLRGDHSHQHHYPPSSSSSSHAAQQQPLSAAAARRAQRTAQRHVSHGNQERNQQRKQQKQQQQESGDGCEKHGGLRDDMQDNGEKRGGNVPRVYLGKRHASLRSKGTDTNRRNSNIAGGVGRAGAMGAGRDITETMHLGSTFASRAVGSRRITVRRVHPSSSHSALEAANASERRTSYEAENRGLRSSLGIFNKGRKSDKMDKIKSTMLSSQLENLAFDESLFLGGKSADRGDSQSKMKNDTSDINGTPVDPDVQRHMNPWTNPGRDTQDSGRKYDVFRHISHYFSRKPPQMLSSNDVEQYGTNKDNEDNHQVERGPPSSSDHEVPNDPINHNTTEQYGNDIRSSTTKQKVERYTNVTSSDSHNLMMDRAKRLQYLVKRGGGEASMDKENKGIPNTSPTTKLMKKIANDPKSYRPGSIFRNIVDEAEEEEVVVGDDGNFTAGGSPDSIQECFDNDTYDAYYERNHQHGAPFVQLQEEEEVEQYSIGEGGRGSGPSHGRQSLNSNGRALDSTSARYMRTSAMIESPEDYMESIAQQYDDDGYLYDNSGSYQQQQYGHINVPNQYLPEYADHIPTSRRRTLLRQSYPGDEVVLVDDDEDIYGGESFDPYIESSVADGPYQTSSKSSVQTRVTVSRQAGLRNRGGYIRASSVLAERDMRYGTPHVGRRGDRMILRPAYVVVADRSRYTPTEAHRARMRQVHRGQHVPGIGNVSNQRHQPRNLSRTIRRRGRLAPSTMYDESGRLDVQSRYVGEPMSSSVYGNRVRAERIPEVESRVTNDALVSQPYESTSLRPSRRVAARRSMGGYRTVRT